MHFHVRQTAVEVLHTLRYARWMLPVEGQTSIQFFRDPGVAVTGLHAFLNFHNELAPDQGADTFALCDSGQKYKMNLFKITDPTTGSEDKPLINSVAA